VTCMLLSGIAPYTRGEAVATISHSSFEQSFHSPIKGWHAFGANPRETLIKSKNQISYGFVYIASSSSSLHSSLFASDDSLLCMKIQE